MLVTVLLGFARTYYLAGIFRAPLPSLVIHIHGAAFTVWILLLVTQTSLVAAGRTDIHRKLGIAGFLVGCLMIILGVMASTDSLVRHAGQVGPSGLDAGTFYIIPLSDILLFAVFLFLAFRNRRDSPAHKSLHLSGHHCAPSRGLRSLAVRLHCRTFPGCRFKLRDLSPVSDCLRPLVHPQDSSRHPLGRRLPDLRPASPHPPRQNWPLALLRRLGNPPRTLTNRPSPQGPAEAAPSAAKTGGVLLFVSPPCSPFPLPTVQSPNVADRVPASNISHAITLLPAPSRDIVH